MVNTQYDIKQAYSEAVANYLPAPETPIYPQLDHMIESIASEIIGAHQMRPCCARETGIDPFPMDRACYVIVQGRDAKSGTDTSKLIREASEEERKIFAYVIQKLRVDYFTQLGEKDLKAGALLFGMPQIHQFTLSGKAPQPQPALEQAAADLDLLITKKRQFETFGNSPQVQTLLGKMEEVIAKSLPQLIDPATGAFKVPVTEAVRNYFFQMQRQEATA